MRISIRIPPEAGGELPGSCRVALAAARSSLLVLGLAGALAAQETTIAPEESAELTLHAPCDAIEWAPTEAAFAWELVVIELGGAGSDPAPPVVEATIAGGATRWAPAEGACLEPGRRYLWTVRPVTPRGTGEWSTPLLFETIADESEEPAEYEESYADSDADAPVETTPVDPTPTAEAPRTPPGTTRTPPRVAPRIPSPRTIPQRPPGPIAAPSPGGATSTRPPATAPDPRKTAIAGSAVRRPTAADLQDRLRRARFDWEIVSFDARNAPQNALVSGEELELDASVRVNGATDDDPVSFYLGVTDHGAERAVAASERIEGRGPGPHAVRLSVPAVPPLFRGNELTGVLQVMTGRRLPGLPGREPVLHEPIEDRETRNHRRALRYAVIRPEIELVEVARVGSGTVAAGDTLELVVRARGLNFGPLRVGIAPAIGDPAASRIDAAGPKVFRQGNGAFPESRMRVRVGEEQIVDGAFRATLFLLRDAPTAAPFVERLHVDGNPANDRRELVYPVERPEPVRLADRTRGVDPDCKSAAKVAGDLWQKFRETAKEAGCLSPFKRRNLETVSACLVEGATLPVQLADKMIGHWNDLAQGGWATLGPRRITPGTMKGQVVPLGQRLFVGASPAGTGEIEIALRQVDGRAGAEITICQTFADGSSAKVRQTRIEPRTEHGYLLLETIADPEASILSIKVDHKGGPAPIPVFGYELEVKERPRRVKLPPVDGFADLHLHQMARLAHAGHWFWGEHDGPRSEALSYCSSADHAMPEWVPGMVIRHGRADELGYRDWPTWDDVAHQQVWSDWLNRAHRGGLDLAVVSAVNFEPLCFILKTFFPNQNTEWGCRDMPNIRRQIEAAHEFDLEHDWYEIALNPWHARQIIHEGKLAVVLSIEASNLMPREDGDVSKQLADLYGLGVRTLQLAHENDSRFAGAAPHLRIPFGPFQKLKNPLAGGFSLDAFDLDENGKNKLGLRREGERLVELMIDYRMPIDLAHLSERSVDDVYRIARANRSYPLYNSHTRFLPVLSAADRKKQREFLSTCRQISYIERTGGMVGLRTGDNALRGVTRSGVANDCPGSSKSFAQMVGFGNAFSRVPFGFGSDFNGFISQVAPRYGPDACAGEEDDGQRAHYVALQGKNGPEATASFNVKGLAHVGLLPDLVTDLRQVGADTSRLDRSAEAFLRMWERAWDDRREELPSTVECETWNRF